jgi:hypothetical protein
MAWTYNKDARKRCSVQAPPLCGEKRGRQAIVRQSRGEGAIAVDQRWSQVTASLSRSRHSARFDCQPLTTDVTKGEV